MNADTENTRFGVYRRCRECGIWSPEAGFFRKPGVLRCMDCEGVHPRARSVALAARHVPASATAGVQWLLSGAGALGRAA